jgi:hypothetical protein
MKSILYDTKNVKDFVLDKDIIVMLPEQMIATFTK